MDIGLCFVLILVFFKLLSAHANTSGLATLARLKQLDEYEYV